MSDQRPPSSGRGDEAVPSSPEVGQRADAFTEVRNHLGRLAAQTFTRAAGTLQGTLDPGVGVVSILSGKWGGGPHLVALTTSGRVMLISQSGQLVADLPVDQTAATAAGATLTLSSEGRIFEIQGMVSGAQARSFASSFSSP